MDRIRQPSPALIIAVLALVAALAGTAVAGPGASTSASVKKAQFKKLKKRVKALEQQGQPPAPGTPGENTGAPAGAVSFFNLPTCPSGWTELTAARGRYIVGLPVDGTLAGTAGTALTDLENRAVGEHTHDVTDPGHRHFFGIDQGATDASSQVGEFQDTAEPTIFSDVDQTSLASTGITINNAGTVAGTNSPYIQLLVCEKG